MFTIRPATPADATAIATVHVSAWRTAYQGIIPQAALDALSVARRALAWDRQLRDPASREFAFVAEAGGELVGFAAGGPPRHPERGEDGELYAIYLLAEWRGAGLGAALFRAVVDRHRSAGVTALYLWVLAANTIGRRFYERQGGVAGSAQTIEIGGVPFTEIAYVWPDLQATGPA